MNQLLFWIHGPKASGKTTIARLLTRSHKDSVTIQRGTSETATRRLLQNANVAVFEEYTETDIISPSLISAITGEPLAVAQPEGKPVRRIQLHLDVIIVVSEHPPKNPELKSRFRILSTGSQIHRKAS